MAGFRPEYEIVLNHLLKGRPQEYIALPQQLLVPHWRPGIHLRTSVETELETPLLRDLMPMLIPDRAALWSARAPNDELLCWSCGSMSGEPHSTPGRFQCCSGCKVARYCSRACQYRHWKEHREACADMSELFPREVRLAVRRHRGSIADRIVHAVSRSHVSAGGHF